jgi:hypothetical protein
MRRREGRGEEKSGREIKPELLEDRAVTIVTWGGKKT